jgi:putative ABC transport system ATP-binding protein
MRKVGAAPSARRTGRRPAWQVVVDGHELTSLDESERAVLRRRTIGVVFQADDLVPIVSIRDNYDLPGR